MKTKEEILKEHMGAAFFNSEDTANAFIVKMALQAMEEYKVQILEDVKFSFDICSDTSAFCLGYRNLVERIRREKENQPIDKSISPVKPYKHE